MTDAENRSITTIISYSYNLLSSTYNILNINQLINTYCIHTPCPASSSASTHSYSLISPRPLTNRLPVCAQNSLRTQASYVLKSCYSPLNTKHASLPLAIAASNIIRIMLPSNKRLQKYTGAYLCRVGIGSRFHPKPSPSLHNPHSKNAIGTRERTRKERRLLINTLRTTTLSPTSFLSNYYTMQSEHR